MLSMLNGGTPRACLFFYRTFLCFLYCTLLTLATKWFPTVGLLVSKSFFISFSPFGCGFADEIFLPCSCCFYLCIFLVTGTPIHTNISQISPTTLVPLFSPSRGIFVFLFDRLNLWKIFPAGEVEFLLFLFFSFIFSYVLSWISFQLIERPCVLIGRRVISYFFPPKFTVVPNA